jgi:hypothetical protein
MFCTPCAKFSVQGDTFKKLTFLFLLYQTYLYFVKYFNSLRIGKPLFARAHSSNHALFTHP